MVPPVTLWALAGLNLHVAAADRFLHSHSMGLQDSIYLGKCRLELPF